MDVGVGGWGVGGVVGVGRGEGGGTCWMHLSSLTENCSTPPTSIQPYSAKLGWSLRREAQQAEQAQRLDVLKAEVAQSAEQLTQLRDSLLQG